MDRSKIPSLDDLRAFEATARLGSVRGAADALALTHGAVSRRITNLARVLGVKLFERHGRGLRLMSAGETLQITLSRFFVELTNTIEYLRAADTEHETLVLSCEPSVAVRWLIPRLNGFQSAFPHIALHLSVGGGPIEFRKDRIDLAIRRLDFGLPEAWHVRRLFAERVGPVLTLELMPSFAAGRYVALASRTRPEAWAQWLAAHPGVAQPSDLRFYDHHSLSVEAASAGLGVALSPLVLATDDIERGRLLAPMGFDPDGSHYGLIWTGELGASEGRFNLARWLEQECTWLAGAAPA